MKIKPRDLLVLGKCLPLSYKSLGLNGTGFLSRYVQASLEPVILLLQPPCSYSLLSAAMGKASHSMWPICTHHLFVAQ